MEGWAGIVLAAGNGRAHEVTNPQGAAPHLRQADAAAIPWTCLRGLGVGRIIVVVSPLNRAAIEGLLGDSVDYALQPEPLGTADAVNCALPLLGNACSQVLVQNGDTPLVQPDSIRLLTNRHQGQGNQMTMLTGEGQYAQDMGRVMRDDQGQIAEIVEAKDFTGCAEAPAEVNAGSLLFPTGLASPGIAGPAGQVPAAKNT